MTHARSSIVLAVLAIGCERATPTVVIVAHDDRRALEAAPQPACPVLAPRPPRLQAADPAPLATSSIAVNIPISLAATQPELDRLIPNLSDPGWPQTHKLADTVCATWYFDRRPIRLTMEGPRLRVVIPGDFGMIADPHLGPLGCTKPFVSCGDKSTGAAPIPAQLNLSATLGISNNYRVVASLTNDGTTLLQPCKLIGNVNTTSLVTSAIDDQIARKLSALNATISSKADFRPQVDAAWSAIQRPQKVADDLWLIVHPAALEGRVSGADPNTISVQVVARGIIELVKQPAAPAVAVTPLPDLTPAAQDIAPGAHVGAVGSISYDMLSKQLRTLLVGKDDNIEYPAGVMHHVVVRDVQMTGPVKCKTPPDTNKCVSVAVEFTGDICGVVYLIGRPASNDDTQDIGIQDLEFSLSTSDAVVNTAAWLAHGSIVDRLKREARVSLAAAATDAKRRVHQALQTKLARDWRLSGNADTVTLHVNAGAAGLDYAIDLSGTLTVSLPAP
jgi:hypothetical protein